jgi:hypothetical protein
MTDTIDVGLVAQLIERIRPLLSGQLAPVQGAVLADLLAAWLAGHIDRSSNSHTAALREELLRHHLATVRALVPINAAHIHARSV